MRSTAARFFTMGGSGSEYSSPYTTGGSSRGGSGRGEPGKSSSANPAAAFFLGAAAEDGWGECEAAAALTLPAARDSADEGTGAMRRFPRAQAIPRPLFARQLHAAIYGEVVPRRSANGTSSNNSTREDHDEALSRRFTVTPDMTSGQQRIGESTVLIDGAACSMVSICGRVLYRLGPFENGSFARYISTLPQRHQHHDNDGTAASLLSLEQSMSCGMPFQPPMSASSGGGGSRSQRAFAATPHPHSLLVVTDTTGSVGVIQHHTVLFGATTDSGGGGDGAGAFSSPHIPEEELDVLVNDYVVVTGRLSFADVDADSVRCFAEARAPLPPPARVLRADLTVVAMARAGAADATAEEPGGHCTDAPLPPLPLSAADGWTHVLLPGAEVPVPLSDLREQLGMDATSLPPGARLLHAPGVGDAHHGISDGNGDVDAHGPQPLPALCAPLPHEADTSWLTATAAPRFCLKGRVRLVASSDEINFWALSAIEAHLRYTGATPKRAKSDPDCT